MKSSAIATPRALAIRSMTSRPGDSAAPPSIRLIQVLEMLERSASSACEIPSLARWKSTLNAKVSFAGAWTLADVRLIGVRSLAQT